MVRTLSSAKFIYQFIYQLFYREYENKEKEARNDPPLKNVEKERLHGGWDSSSWPTESLSTEPPLFPNSIARDQA